MKIGRIRYLNTEPFFADWNGGKFPVVEGAPRPLAQLAKSGDIAAAPLPIVECWGLEKEFSPLGRFGIAVKQESGSVFVLSKKPFKELNAAVVGLTQESSTSVILAKVLIEEKYGHHVRMKRGFLSSDDAWLVIGDEALALNAAGPSAEWPYLTDLAAEWWSWKKLPFVFARWIARNDTPSPVLHELGKQVESSLASGRQQLDVIAQQGSSQLHIPAPILLRYLRSFIYELGPQEEAAIAEFRRLAQKSHELIAS